MNKISIDAATQLNKIISFLSKDMTMKIPQDILDIIEIKTDNSLNIRINGIEDINEENLLNETKKYLSFIFFNYLADEEEKQEYNKILKNNEENYQKLLRQKYNVDNIFNQNKKTVTIENKEIELPAVVKKNLFTFVLDKIRNIFIKR